MTSKRIPLNEEKSYMNIYVMFYVISRLTLQPVDGSGVGARIHDKQTSIRSARGFLCCHVLRHIFAREFDDSISSG